MGRFIIEVDDLQDKLDELAVLYRQVAQDMTDRPDQETHDAGRISGVGHSDPTGSVVIQHEHTRAVLRRAFAKIEGMNKSMDALAERLMSLYDPVEHETLRRYTTPDPATVAAQTEARKAVERRIQEEKRHRLEARLKRLRMAG